MIPGIFSAKNVDFSSIFEHWTLKTLGFVRSDAQNTVKTQVVTQIMGSTTQETLCQEITTTTENLLKWLPPPGEKRRRCSQRGLDPPRNDDDGGCHEGVRTPPEMTTTLQDWCAPIASKMLFLRYEKVPAGMLLLRNVIFEVRKSPCGHATAQKCSF